jgi:hypothetical protein
LSVSGGAFHMPPDGSGLRLQPTKPSSLTQRFSSAIEVSGVTPGVCGSWHTPTKFFGKSSQTR